MAFGLAFGNKRIGNKKSRFQLNLIKFVNRKIVKKCIKFSLENEIIFNGVKLYVIQNVLLKFIAKYKQDDLNDDLKWLCFLLYVANVAISNMKMTKADVCLPKC